MRERGEEQDFFSDLIGSARKYGRSAPIAALCLLWASPCSLLGLALGLPILLAGGSARRRGRTVEIASSYADCRSDSPLRRLPFAAITFGHVILGTSHAELARLRPHERVHVRQYERWGPLFLLAYPAASLAALLRGRCPYRENRFEVEACRDTGATKIQ
jgi:hypothetical protein